MIAFYRSASIAPGKRAGATAFANEVSAYIKDATGVEVSVAVPVGGNPLRVGWAARYDNLGTMEATMGRLMADPKYVELSAKGAENFIPGSVRDEFWRAIRAPAGPGQRPALAAWTAGAARAGAAGGPSAVTA